MKKFICGSVLLLALVNTPVWADIPVEERSFNAQQSQSEEPPMNNDTSPVVETTPANSSYNGNEPADNSTFVVTNNSDQAPTPAPVNNDMPPPAALQNLPIEQRVSRLEAQTSNMANMNMPQQILQLQQEVARLRGVVDVQNHELELLNKQIKENPTARVNQPVTPPAANNNKIENNLEKAPASVNTSELQDASTYGLAFGLMSKRQFEKARLGFSNYLTKYPSGKYAGDAHYWLGEIYSINKNYDKALSEFQMVLNKYGTSAKIADSKLKIAIIHASTGSIDLAKTELRAIKLKYPNSTAAQLANIRLQQLEG